MLFSLMLLFSFFPCGSAWAAAHAEVTLDMLTSHVGDLAHVPGCRTPGRCRGTRCGALPWAVHRLLEEGTWAQTMPLLSRCLAMSKAQGEQI